MQKLAGYIERKKAKYGFSHCQKQKHSEANEKEFYSTERCENLPHTESNRNVYGPKW